MTLRLETEARKVLRAEVADRVVAALRPHWRGARIYLSRRAIAGAEKPDSAAGRFVEDLRWAISDAGGSGAQARVLLMQLTSSHVIV